MRLLTVEHALAVHKTLAPNQHLKHGGEHLLASALSRPSTSYADHQLYAGLFEKAAALLEGITQNHPFTDGNKRTAYTCTVLFLRLNDWTIKPVVTDQQQAEFVVRVADHSLPFESIVSQLEDWAVPYSSI